MKSIILLLLLFIPIGLIAQISGIVREKSTNTPIVGAKITASDGAKAISDFDGKFKLNSQEFPVIIITSMMQFINDTTTVNKAEVRNCGLKVGSYRKSHIRRFTPFLLGPLMVRMISLFSF